MTEWVDALENNSNAMPHRMARARAQAPRPLNSGVPDFGSSDDDIGNPRCRTRRRAEGNAKRRNGSLRHAIAGAAAVIRHARSALEPFPL